MTEVRVHTPHRASYPDPIRFVRGEALRLTGREDIWDGHRWVWAVAPDGREGWIPDTAVNAGGTALEDYSAQELTCHAGEALTQTRRTHGWAWCRSADGREGWVPERNLSI